MNSFDPYRNRHPDIEELDRLRAGLLDDEPARRQALVAHLGGCGDCRARHGIADRVCAALDEQLESPAVTGALRARRRSALAGRSAARREGAPRLALVGAALSVILGIGIFFALEDRSPTGGEVPTLASQEAVPDLYSDLDFYLWLAREREKAAGEGNHS